MNPDGKSSYISKEGLDIHTEPPTEGPALIAWKWFKCRGEQNYDEALTTLQGYRKKTGLYSLYALKSQEVYLKEVKGAKLIRWADVTAIAPKEGEDEGAKDYKVIYMELDFKVRGKLTPAQTDMHNGLNQYAVHLVQMNDGDPWEISLLGGAPLMEK
ncbi:hypothetical protein [Gorillibacterium timonense]|uniref:hypothetical protein n=1 Tax=Gorillibacterium timonense TaxID=1689269 RepID=UPI00071C5AFB|nr:hypothetical protein [Gorillibacterium timonense]